MEEICPKDICTGCAACANVCAHTAISIQEDEHGYLHPHINNQLCVNCGLCVKVCPNNTKPIFSKLGVVYAACAKDSIEQLSSTSGGVASAFSREFIRNGGIVYGCCGTDIANVHHIRIDKTENVELLKGSKYVQSSIGSIFRDVRKDLIEGKRVLFIGTPCQCAGLKNFVGPKLSKFLYTIDFVCHGVPNQRILDSALSCISDKNGEIQTVQFRIKEWKQSVFAGIRYVNKNNIHQLPEKIQYSTRYGLFINVGESCQDIRIFPNDLYTVGFLTGLYYRESCYKCHYTRPERVSEITLGDFHFKVGKNHVTGENRLLSKVLINNLKGQYLLEVFRNVLNLTPFDFCELDLRNSQLAKPIPYNPKRNLFLKSFSERGFECANEILKEQVKDIRRHLLLNELSRIVKSMTRYFYSEKRHVKKDN